MNLSQQTIDDIVWWGHRSTLFLTPHIGVLIGLKQSGSFQHSSPGKTFPMKVIRSRKAFCIVCWEYLQSTSETVQPENRAAELDRRHLWTRGAWTRWGSSAPWQGKFRHSGGTPLCGLSCAVITHLSCLGPLEGARGSKIVEVIVYDPVENNRSRH